MRIISLLGLSTLTLAAPILNADTEATPNRYLVVLKQDQPEGASAILKDHVEDGLFAIESVRHQFTVGSFKGFAVHLTDAQLERLKSDDRVSYLEPDGTAHTKIEAVDTAEEAPGAFVTQSSVTWGLGRISHRAKGSSQYVYDSSAGAGTCSYIVDTGITPGLAEFEGRAQMVKSYIAGANQDDNGHGTHVSGTIGGKTYGVAKKTMIYGIKVLDSSGSGSWSDIIAGIQTAVDDSKTRSCPKGVVINMSLGGSTSQAVNDAAAAAVDAGLFLAVAAGNEASDYHTSSPASEPKVFAVGASDNSDTFAYFSNYGAGLGVIAPGVDVVSIWMDGTTQSLSGTSMATPHVAGLAAYLAGLSPTKLTVAQLKAQIQKLALRNVVTIDYSLRTTPNYLAFNGVPSSTDANAAPSSVQSPYAAAPAWGAWGFGKEADEKP